MDNNGTNISEKLVEYLDGRLEGPEKEQLEQQLSADKSLRAEWENLLAAREAVKLYGLRQQVSTVHQQMMKHEKARLKQRTPVRRIIRYSIAIAASLLVIITVYLGYQFYNLSAEKVYAANFKSFELSTIRDGAEIEDSLERFFRGKQFKNVVMLNYDRPF